MANPVLTAALKNEDEVTHVVTHIEYGSELFINLEYECKFTYFCISLFILSPRNIAKSLGVLEYERILVSVY